MKVQKATITFVAYGKTEDEAIGNILFDMSEIVRQDDAGEDVPVSLKTVDTKDEGIDDLEQLI